MKNKKKEAKGEERSLNQARKNLYHKGGRDTEEGHHGGGKNKKRKER